MSINQQIIHLNDLSKSYFTKNIEHRILKDINFNIYSGDFISISGKSGSGKSTLLNLLAGLDKPTQGIISIFDFQITSNSKLLPQYIRSKSIGFVFQQFYLLPSLTALENIQYIYELLGESKATSYSKSIELLNHVGMVEYRDQKPKDLSGGQIQRIAIARSLINNPKLLLVDEPTGNLDPGSRDNIGKLLTTINQNSNISIVLVTHDPELAKFAKTQYEITNQSLIKL
jgi:ABC-type lipoprotein export system ATPase subunit